MSPSLLHPLPLSHHLWTTPKPTRCSTPLPGWLCLYHMTTLIAAGACSLTGPTAGLTNQYSLVESLSTNKGVMLFPRSSHPFILQQCWSLSAAMHHRFLYSRLSLLLQHVQHIAVHVKAVIKPNNTHFTSSSLMCCHYLNMYVIMHLLHLTSAARSRAMSLGSAA